MEVGWGVLLWACGQMMEGGVRVSVGICSQAPGRLCVRMCACVHKQGCRHRCKHTLQRVAMHGHSICIHTAPAHPTNAPVLKLRARTMERACGSARWCTCLRVVCGVWCMPSVCVRACAA